MTTGEKIKRIRQHRGMTQKELGDAVGLTANRIAQYEMGYRVPKAALLEKMAEVLRISRLALLEPDAGYLSGVMETLSGWMKKHPACFVLPPFNLTIQIAGGTIFKRNKKAWNPACMEI